MWRAHSDGPFSSAQRGVTGCQRISRQVSRHFLAYSVLVFFLRGSGCFKQHFVAPIHSLSLNSSILLTLFTLVYVINLTCAFCRVSASAGVSFEISRSCNSSSIKSIFFSTATRLEHRWVLGSRLECSLLLIGLLYYIICHTSPCIVSMGSPLLPAVFSTAGSVSTVCWNLGCM